MSFPIRKKHVNLGFTLLELLIVMGVLATLFAIVLIAVNPAEQTSRALDYSTEATAEDYIGANLQFFIANHALPWKNDTNCLSEISSGNYLANMPHCIHDVVNNGTLEASYGQKTELKNIYVNKCGDTAVLCYNPKSKIENADAETRYTKFGVNQPGCPAANGNSTDCYWCKPVMQSASCNMNPSPTPSLAPTTPPLPTATNTPTPLAFPQLVPGYANVQSKFFKTYAVYFFDYPGFPPPAGGWDLHLSLNPDFSGDWTQTNLSFGIPSQYGPEGPGNASYTAYRKITMKYVGFASTPANTGVYDLSNCGKTLYYRIANYYNNSATNKLVGPTYTAKFDCTTKVGVVDPPLSWYTVYDQLNGVQKQYDPSWDFDKSGSIDWVDYWLGAFSTKTRYGGWQPPE